MELFVIRLYPSFLLFELDFDGYTLVFPVFVLLSLSDVAGVLVSVVQVHFQVS
jgi:hypothetical protein